MFRSLQLLALFAGLLQIIYSTNVQATNLGSYSYNCQTASIITPFPNTDFTGVIGDIFTISATGASCEVSPQSVYGTIGAGVLTYSISSGGTGTFLDNTPVTLPSGSTMTVTFSAAGHSNIIVSSNGNYPNVLDGISMDVASAVPTLSEWTQILLAILVMSALVWYFRNQQSY